MAEFKTIDEYFLSLADEPALARGDVERVLHDIGYRALPTRGHFFDTVIAVSKGEIDPPPLNTAILAFALDYNIDSPFPAYEVEPMGGMVIGDVGTRDEREQELLAQLGQPRSALKAGRPFPYDGTHTGFVARAYAQEVGISPDSHEASLWAHREVETVMRAINKAREKIGAPVPSRIVGI